MLLVRLDSSSPWGTVCDDGFDKTDAVVACRNLRYTGGSYLGSDQAGGLAVSYKTVETSATTIQMSGLSCTGSEAELVLCPHSTDFECAHAEDVVIECTGRPREAVSYACAWCSGCPYTTMYVCIQPQVRICEHTAPRYGV
jgi:hypothetical protein